MCVFRLKVNIDDFDKTFYTSFFTLKLPCLLLRVHLEVQGVALLGDDPAIPRPRQHALPTAIRTSLIVVVVCLLYVFFETFRCDLWNKTKLHT